MKILITLSFIMAVSIQSVVSATKPNILWIVAEDMSPDLGCYGNTIVTTPNIDRLARGGMQFNQVFVTGPACSPSRTALATGVFQTSLGACNMRYTVPLVDGIRILPELMRDNGYFTGNIKNAFGTGTAKDDWIFTTTQKTWDTNSWDELKSRQPFYGQINFSESHRGFSQKSRYKIDPDKVTFPSYYPDHPIARRDWAGYLMEVNRADEHVGKILAQLEADGLTDNTIIVFLSDHGRPMIRGKNWLYDSGTQIPLIVYYPPKLTQPARYNTGGVSHDLISSIDLVAETLLMAGGEIPDWMQGRSFLQQNSTTRKFVPMAVDVIGNIETCSRAIRTDSYKYIRNFKRPGSINECTTPYRRANHPIYHLLNVMNKRQLLTGAQAQLLEPLATEELYDLKADTHEIINLIGNPEYVTVHQQLKSALSAWLTNSKDLGLRSVDHKLRLAIENYGTVTLAKQQGQIKALRTRVENEFSLPSL